MADNTTTPNCCTKCKAWKYPADFAADKRKKSGLSSWCRACTNAAVKANNSRKAGN